MKRYKNNRKSKQGFFSMGKDYSKNGSWKPAIFARKNETFALNVEVANHKLRIERVMLAEREKCDRFLTTILIPDPLSPIFPSPPTPPPPRTCAGAGNGELALKIWKHVFPEFASP